MIELDNEMRKHLKGVVDDLVNVTAGVISRKHLATLVDEAFQMLAKTATIATFLPILVEKYVRTQIRAKQLDSGDLLKDKPEVLVLCEQNRGRSQAAAALLRFYAPGKLHVESAGCDPGQTPNSRVVAYLREHGVKLTDYPKTFTEEMVRVTDHLVVIGDLSCELPSVPNQDRTFLPISDPEDADRDSIAEIMAQVDGGVRDCVRTWLPDLSLHKSVVGTRASG